MKYIYPKSPHIFTSEMTGSAAGRVLRGHPRIMFWLLKSGLIILTAGAFFPSIAASKSILHTPFQKLSEREEATVILRLESSQMGLVNGIESHIQNLSEVYQISVRIIRQLENMARLQSERLRLNTFQGQFTALKEISIVPDPMELDKEEWRNQIRLLEDPNKSPYRETERGAAIRILGVIGGRQKVPPETVYNLRSLMFQMENPNIRNNVIHAFKNMILLHPPDSKTMRKLAEWMKKLRETNKKITILRNHYFKLREQYEKEGKSLPEIIEEIKIPPSLIGGLSENSQIYDIVRILAQKHFLPDEIIQELGLALEGDENKFPGDSNRIILADNLLNALFAVVQKQNLPENIISRLKALDDYENYFSNDSVTPNDILEKPSSCKMNFVL